MTDREKLTNVEAVLEAALGRAKVNLWGYTAPTMIAFFEGQVSGLEMALQALKDAGLIGEIQA